MDRRWTRTVGALTADRVGQITAHRSKRINSHGKSDHRFLSNTVRDRLVVSQDRVQDTSTIPRVVISGVNTPEEPSAGTSTGVKRKRDSAEDLPGHHHKAPKLSSSVAPPAIGRRPIFQVSVKKPCEKDFVKVRALMDSGATTFCLSDRFVRRFSIPKVQRDQPTQVTDVAGRLLPGGQAFTQPLLFQISQCVFKQPFEIIPMESGYDFIIPDWWRDETGLVYQRSMGDCPSTEWTVSFTKLPARKQTNDVDAKRVPISDAEPKSEDFIGPESEDFIEWDESILVGKDEPIHIGTVAHAPGIPKMHPDGTWQPTTSLRVSISAVSEVELKTRLPECYHQFLKLFAPQMAKELPIRRPYDHAIDLLPGTNPPWGPVYSMSEVELKALREYLEEIVQSRKI